ncbi:MAG TPA: hypothetical protein VLO30_10325 [Chthoniobacterales bacterium]|nr:hypothetical protein [Chthoniobacterales bacterium]
METDSNAGVNGNPAKIEIFTPFGAAYEWMKAMLLRPFDVVRWLTIAFAAFLAGNFGGNAGGNLGRLGRFRNGDWRYRATRHGDFPSDLHIETWLIAGVVAVVLLALVLAFVWMWVSSRGRFVFTDCVVKNRAAIKEPWREFRREGNSYFLFSLVVAAGMIFLIGITLLAGWVPFQTLASHESGGAFALPLVLVCLLVLIWLVLALFFGLVSQFMVPVMYRRRCLAREAFLDVTKLIFRNPAPFVLFVLFGIALGLGLAVVGMLVACFTCCIGGLPYVSTVLLLPAIVWLAAFKLLFFRQFGDAYDVWATPGVAIPVIEPATPPPITPAG